MSRRRSLRARLTAVFLAVATPLLVAAAIGADALVRRSIWASVDAAVVEEAETLASIGEAQTPSALADSVARVGKEQAPGPDKFVRAIDASRTVRASYGRIPAGLDAAPPHAPGVNVTNVWQDGVPFRVARYVTDADTSYEVGVAVRGQVELLARARRFIVAVLAALLVIIGALAWIVTGRATVELTRLADELETIETTALGRPLSARETAEVDRLAAVLNRLLARLASAMDSLRRFTADAAHELRTPIAALRTHVELALGQAPREGTLRDQLVDVVEQVDRVGRLAENLLMLSAIEAGERAEPSEPVALDRLVAEVAEEIEPIAQEQDRTITCRTEPGVIVRGAPVLLKRLLLNLADNALRHTPPGTSIELSVGRNQQGVVVEIADDGPGIAPDELPRVFERFHRGRGASAGTGLGLAICREIALVHRGEITIESPDERGTRVRVTLPAV